MLKKLIVPYLFAICLLAACSANPAPSPSQVPAEMPTGVDDPALPTAIPEQTAESPAATAQQEVYPPPISLPVIGVGAYPDPTQDVESEEVGSGIVEPVDGEEDQNSGGGQLVESEVFIDNVQVNVNNGELPQVTLVITGSLPTPCHQFAASIGQPDPEGNINVRAYSLVDPDSVCAQMLQPFEETINLGSFPSGKYSLLVNGEVIQELEF